MRLRTDDFRTAGYKRAHKLGARKETSPPILKKRTPVAKPGDVWVIRMAVEKDEMWTSPRKGKGAIVGYALTCPNEACPFGVHDWTWANNCTAKTSQSRCQHMAERRSCWDWTGSIKDDSLTAAPSLHSPTELGGCGWHGWLRDGRLTPA